MSKRLLFIFVLYMAFIGGNYMVYNLVLPVRVAHHIILSGLLVYWFYRHGLPDTPMLLPVGLMLLSVLTSTAGALDSRMALENAWHWITNLGLFIVLIDWQRREGLSDFLFRSHFVVGAVLAATCLIQAFLMPGSRVAGALLLISLAGAYMAALVVPVMVRWFIWLGHSTEWEPYHYILLAAGLIAALIQNGSRGAALSVGVSCLVFVVLNWRPARWVYFSWATGVIALLVAVVVWSNQPGHSSGDEIRMDLWRAGGEMVSTYPIGVGPGLFGQVYRELGRRPIEDGLTGAHNLYINLGAELGGPGLTAGAIFLLLGLYYLVGKPMDLMQKAALAALAGILAHMLGDNFPAQNWTFLVSFYAAYLLKDVRTGWRLWEVPLFKIVSNLLAAGVLVYGLLMVTFDQAQIPYEVAIETGNVSAAQMAVKLDPGLKLYQLNLARMEGDMATVQRLDPTIGATTDLWKYGLVNYARRWQ